VSVVVVTDGERVLGLGDLGAGGLAISEGKILLYTTMAGVPPSACLPLCLDVGTNNQALLDDPGYKGLRRARLRGPSYDALVEELVTALRAWRPRGLVLQFEDFGADNAFALLERYRHGMVRTCGCHARSEARTAVFTRRVQRPLLSQRFARRR
jgi:malate dehydrogenase (oxaloacetate-decarboxylating)(NADP+)